MRSIELPLSLNLQISGICNRNYRYPCIHNMISLSLSLSLSLNQSIMLIRAQNVKIIIIMSEEMKLWAIVTYRYEIISAWVERWRNNGIWELGHLACIAQLTIYTAIGLKIHKYDKVIVSQNVKQASMQSKQQKHLWRATAQQRRVCYILF